VTSRLGTGKPKTFFYRAVSQFHTSPLSLTWISQPGLQDAIFFSSQKYIYYQTSMHPADIPIRQHHHSIWPLQVPAADFWPDEGRNNLPAADG
jgi:hypothetical protein